MPRKSPVKSKPERRSDRTGATVPPSDLSESEQDLYSHLQAGYELETDSLGSGPLLRRRNDQEVIRPLSATRNTVKALEGRGLITPKKSSSPLRIVWALNGSKSRKSTRAKAARARRA